jgi:hypothetical protein
MEKMFIFESKEKKVSYCEFGIRFQDDELLFTPVIINKIKKSGKGPQWWIRFSISVGTNDDGTFYNACLVLDVPIKSEANWSIIEPDKDGKIHAEIAALSSFDITDPKNNKKKNPFPKRKDFTRTFLSIAVSLAYQLGCTHLILTDAANLRISEKENQLLSEKTLLGSGKTFYEKYGFVPLEPLDPRIRNLKDLNFNDLTEENQNRLEKLINYIDLTNLQMKQIFNNKDESKNKLLSDAAAIIFSTLPEELSLNPKTGLKDKKNYYGLVRDYELSIAPCSFSNLKDFCILEQFETINIEGDESEWSKKYSKDFLKFMSSYDFQKMDVVI